MTEVITKPKTPQGSTPPRPKKKAPPPPKPKWQQATLGLSRVLGQQDGEGQGPDKDEEPEGHVWNESEDDADFLYGEDGEIVGTERTTERTVGAGARGEAKTESSSFDGTTKKSLSAKAEGLAGAEASIKKVSSWSPEKISHVLEVGAKAGAFGEAAYQASVQRGHMSVESKGEVKGGAGAETGATMSAEITMDEMGDIATMQAAIEAFAKVGVWVEGEAEVKAKLGPLVAQLKGAIEAWAGAQASFSANVLADLKNGQFSADFEAEAKAGAGASAEGKASVDLGFLGLAVKGKAEAFAGAQASAEGHVRFGVSGVSIQFAASAFAGAKASAEGKASIRIMGRTVLKAKGKVEVSAGAGGEIAGEFTIESGVVKFNAALSAALGIGTGAAAEIEADFGAVAEVLAAAYEELTADDDNKAILDIPPDYKREPLADKKAGKKHEQFAYETLYPDFLAYAKKKSMQGDNGVKQDKVQEIIKNAGPTLRSHIAFVETDTGIDRAAKDAFGPLVEDFGSEAGRIIRFVPATGTAVAGHKADMKQEEKWRKVRDPLHADFLTYAQELESTEEATVSNERLLKIIKKHKSKLNEAFPGEQDAVVKWAMKDLVGTFIRSIDEVDVAKGTVAVTPTVARAAKAKEAYKQGTRGNALVEMEAGLNAIVAELRGDPKAVFNTKTVAKANDIITPVYNQLAGNDAEKKDAEVKKLVLRPFKGILDDVVFVGGQIRGVDQTKGWREALNAEAAQKKEEASVEQAKATFRSGLLAYSDKKTAKGENSIKMTRVQEQVTKAAAKAPKWVTSAEGAAGLAQIAKEVLGDALGVLVISGGVVEKLTINETKFGQRKKDRQDFGRAVLGDGENLDPRRRQMVANNLRTPLGDYRAKLMKTTRSQDAFPDKEKLQDLLDLNLSAIGADILGPAGSEAIADTIKRHFPEVKSVAVERLQIVAFEAKTPQELSGERSRKEAVEHFTKKFEKIDAPTVAKVQKAIDSGSAAILKALDAAVADEVLAEAITAAFGDRVNDVRVVNKKASFTPAAKNGGSK